MILWIFFTFCVSVIGEAGSSTTPGWGCRSDIIPCARTGGRSGARRSGTATTPGWVEREAASVRSDHHRRRPARRRVARRKVHRHSTRVLNFKPAVILLPPFDVVPASTTNRLDPFIINVANFTTTSRSATTTLGFDLQALPLEDHQTTTPGRLEIPRTFLLPPPPFADQRDNFIEDIVQLENPVTSNFASYERPTTARYAKTRHREPTINITGQDNPFVKLEKEYNDIQKIVEYDLAKESSTNRSIDEDSGSPQYSAQQRASYEDYSPTPAYNSTTVQYAERWNESFFEERSLKNDYTKTKNTFNIVNNSLLAPEVASLGMKILTSREGMEMLKEFTVLNNETSYDEPAFSEGNVRLETAETGDFRLQAYDNQILTFEDSNDVTKEALKAIKKTHKPFQICNGRQGYVPDSASGCQIFYICLGRGAGEPMMCPNGTLFNQDFLVCDWWYNVECNG